MLINKNTKIIGKKVVLVPYRSQHVPKYHKWMQSEELQKLTCSMPLTLEQEYDMQRSWQIDEDKLTFIVLDKETYEATSDEIGAMIGDTNLFILPSESDAEDGNIIAEPEIMIAESAARGKGCGMEAMMLMLQYGLENLKIQTFTAKIVEDNSISLHLFEKLGFKKVNYSQVFKEVTLELKVNETLVSTLNEHLKGIKVINYE